MLAKLKVSRRVIHEKSFGDSDNDDTFMTEDSLMDINEMDINELGRFHKYSRKGIAKIMITARRPSLARLTVGNRSVLDAGSRVTRNYVGG